MGHHLFLDNVIYNGLTDTIFPLALSSVSAARFIAMLDWRIDAVYIDSAHEKGETLVELHLYYELLRPGGVLFGDDYDAEIFPSVRQDVDLFARCKGLVPTIF